MMRKVFFLTLFITGVSLFFTCSRKHPTRPDTEACAVTIDTSAIVFPDSNEKTFTVNSRIDSLVTYFKAALSNDTIATVLMPVRVMFLLDNSSSMCSDSGNDKENIRIAATRMFVDSLIKETPHSEIGVLRFYGQTTFKEGSLFVPPLPLGDPANLALINVMIDSAGCKTAMAKTRRLLETYTGSAVNKALALIDSNYALIKDSLTRHIVILTDGAWDDSMGRGAQQIINNYKAKYPDRLPPRIHGVFMALHPDSAAQHTDLKLLTELTGGLYFPGESALTITQKFYEILQRFRVVQAEQLKEVSFVNSAGGGQVFSDVSPSSPYENTYFIKGLSSLPLHNGTNGITVSMTVQVRDSANSTPHDSVITRSFMLNRSSTTPFDTANSDYIVECK